MNNKKLTIKTTKHPAVTIKRNAIVTDRLVYIAVANKKFHYPNGDSQIVYIGTTKAGAIRIAGSAACRAQELLDLHGVSELKFHVVTCVPRQAVRTWAKLETSLILAFKQLYGTPPKCNTKGKKQRWSDELDYFTRKRLDGVIQQYS